MNNIIGIQEYLRPELPHILNCKDYDKEKRLLKRGDEILRLSGIEKRFLELSLRKVEAEAEKTESRRYKANELERSSQALRCMVLKHLFSKPYREVAKLLALSPLYRWFCKCESLGVVEVPSKSTLHRYAHWLPIEEMEKILNGLTKAITDEKHAKAIGLEMELESFVLFVDSTCLKANIHFPTDWVLMRDAARTLIKSILLIRKHGLKNRMIAPEIFLSEINKLSMDLSMTGRKPGSKKEKKRLFRKIKQISKLIEEHGHRYRNMLDANWEKTELSRAQAEVILRRMDNVLEQLPEARDQAHERIIGERLVANDKKILSLYERDIHLIKRGKAGAEVEVGNSLFLAESMDGYILDHELKREKSPGVPLGTDPFERFVRDRPLRMFH